MRRGTGLILLSAFLWGTTFPATRYGLEAGGLRPYSFLYFRFALATVILLAFALPLRRVQWDLFADWRVLAMGVLNALGYVFQYVAQDTITGSTAALLVNVNVLITALLAWAILHERIAKSTGVGAVLGVAGVVLLTTNGDFSTVRLSNAEFVGDVLAFGTGMCWTVYILTMKHYFTQKPKTDVIGVTVVVFVLTTVLLFPLALITDGVAFHGTMGGFWILLYLSVFPTSFALWAYQEGLKTTSAALSAVTLLFEPVVAVTLGFFLLNEGWTLWTGVGAILILGAIYLASRTPSAADPGQGAPEAIPATEKARVQNET